MPKIHPADAANAAMIENAVRFEIALFIGTGHYEKAEAPTIEEAREAAKRLRAEHPDCSRTPIIYAITADERSAIVKEEAMPKHATKQTVYSTKFAATRAAKNSGLKKWEVEQIGPKQFVFHTSGKPAAEKKASPKKAAAPKPKAEAAAKAPSGKRAAIAEAAAQGALPPPPDFSAPTHARFRKKLGELIALVEARDVKGLEAFPINPVSSSPKAMAKYRDLAVIALKASKKAA